MPTERNDFYKLGDNFVTIVGDDVKVGDTAPEFTSSLPGWAKVSPLQESKGKVIILSAVPSLETDVCDREPERLLLEDGRQDSSRGPNLDPMVGRTSR